VPILQLAACEINADIIEFLLDIVQTAQHIDRVNKLSITQDEKRQTV
jgi:hypothetical protein